MTKDYANKSDVFIKTALEAAAVDYTKLMRQRNEIEAQLAEIDREVAKLSFKVVSLAALCDEIPKTTAVVETLKDVSKIGLTEAVRIVLRASGEWMKATEVRDQILKLGIDLSKYQNPLASVYTILNRLDKEVDVSSTESSSSMAAKHRAAKQSGEYIIQADRAKLIYKWKGRVETVWDRLYTLPREKADEIVKETAESIANERWRKFVMRD